MSSFDTDQAILDINPPYYFVAGRVTSFTTISFDGLSYQISLDLQEPLSLTLKNFVKANWPLQSMLTASRIKFGNKWYDDYGSYQIHFRDSNIGDRPLTISWQYTYISHMIDIHIFVRKNSQARPAELDDIRRSIEYLIQTNRVSLPIALPYSSFMHIVRAFDIVEQQPLETLWRAVIQVEIRYHKATSN
jgi:hypothetical protein